MREVLFRGKTIESDDWIEGSLLLRNDKAYIDFQYKSIGNGEMFELVEVYPESVGQFIGISYGDRKIFEGDILKFKHHSSIQWDMSEILYFGEIDALGVYPSFDLNGQFIKHHHFEGNALAEVWENDFEIQWLGRRFDNQIFLKK